jgi:hypothetical protein
MGRSNGCCNVGGRVVKSVWWFAGNPFDGSRFTVTWAISCRLAESLSLLPDC